MEIPIWCKAVLSVEEASALADSLNVAIIRAAAYRAIKYNDNSFCAYMSGNKVCIPRVPFERWLEEHGRAHTQFSTNKARADCRELKETPEPVKRTKSRKNIFVRKIV